MERRAAWGSATTKPTPRGHIVRIPVVGDYNPDWDKAFERVLLERSAGAMGYWGTATYHDDVIEIESVTPGREEELGEFIDTCVDHAHMHVRRAREQSQQAQASEAERQQTMRKEAETMADRFRRRGTE
jgi:hypothetical protein